MIDPTKDLAVTVTLGNGTEVLVRQWAADGSVEADVRGTGYGHTWMPVQLVDGAYRVELLEPIPPVVAP